MPQRSNPPPDAGALFAEHGPFLLRVVERLMGPGSHVEDVVQEVFLTVHTKRHTFTADTPWRAYLYRMAFHVVQHHKRSYARRTRLSEAVESQASAEHMPGPDHVLQQRTNAQRVRDAVAQVPLLQRDVLVLYEFEQLSGQQIGELLGIAENTVWSRLRVAREHFKKALLESPQGGA